MEKLYEGLFLLDANEAAKSWSDLENHIDHLLGKIDAKVEYSERWSDKRLAYPVRGVAKGTYFLTYFRAPTDKVHELRRDAQISERILRLMVTREDWTQEEMNRRRDAAAQARDASPPAAPERSEASNGDSPAAGPAEAETVGVPAEASDATETAAETALGDASPVTETAVEDAPPVTETSAEPGDDDVFAEDDTTEEKSGE